MDKSGPLDLPGLLRTWRVEVSGQLASSVAASLMVARSTVANWESGLRTPSYEMLAALDALYDAGGAMLDLAAAIGSSRGLDSRSQWWHNFDSRGGPVWAWVRSEEDDALVRLRMRWGPLSANMVHHCGPRGLVVVAPASVSNPPVQAEIDPPGWVDFGQGTIPLQLQIPAVSALANVRLIDSADHALWIITSYLRPALNSDGRWIEKVKALLGLRGDLVEESLGHAKAPVGLLDLTSKTPDSQDIAAHAWSGSRYRTLREARVFSQSEAATRASMLAPQSPVSDDQVALFESGGQPRVPDLAARLDVVYRADGQTLRQVLPSIRASKGTAVVNVPPWWVGPIWLALEAEFSTTPAEVVLHSPPWAHRLRLYPGTVVATRKSPSQKLPLVVELPPGWSLVAGLGVHSGAIDVNYGWHAVDNRSASWIFNHYHRVYLELFGRTEGDFLRLLRGEGRRGSSR